MSCRLCKWLVGLSNRIIFSLKVKGLLSASGVLLILTVAPFHAIAQAGTPAQQAADQDCEKIEEEIKALQDLLSELSVDRQRIANDLDGIQKGIAQLQQGVRFFSGAGFSEAARGEALDQLAKAMSERQHVEQQLADVDSLIQSMKDTIADLLSKLASCAPPSMTQPPKETPGPQPPASGTTPQKSKTVSMSGFTPIIQLRGFGGATIVNGNAPSTAGFDGAVLFPLGNRVLVGPAAGFQWVSTSLVSTIGGGPPPSTFINTSVGFKNGNFGGQIGFNLSGWGLGIRGGATVAGSTITQAEGVCGTSSTSSLVTCTVTSTTTAHDTVLGPFVGGYISHSIFSHVGVFVEFDYHRQKDDNVLNVSDRAVIGGIVLSLGRHK